MKLHSLFALAGLIVGLTLPALAQQEEEQPPLGEQDYQKLVELETKNDEAWSKRDAAGLAALYTKDALFVTPSGILSGRDAIERRYQDDFNDFQVKGIRVTTVSRVVEAHAVGNNTAWAVGEWTHTVAGPANLVKDIHGHSVILAKREGDAWKWRLLIINVTPATVNFMAYPTATPD
jgi:uncharacterized protein (TIGR02246 family)